MRCVSFEQFTAQFFTFAESSLSEKSIKLYKTILRSFTPFVRGAVVNEITPETIDRYKAKRVKEISPVSVNIELRMLKAMFSTAKR